MGGLFGGVAESVCTSAICRMSFRGQRGQATHRAEPAGAGSGHFVGAFHFPAPALHPGPRAFANQKKLVREFKLVVFFKMDFLATSSVSDSNPASPNPADEQSALGGQCVDIQKFFCRLWMSGFLPLKTDSRISCKPCGVNKSVSGNTRQVNKAMAGYQAKPFRVKPRPWALHQRIGIRC